MVCYRKPRFQAAARTFRLLEADHQADHEAAPFRLAIRPLRRILASVQNDIANIIRRVKRFLQSGGNHRTLLPTVHNSKWNTVRACAHGSPTVQGRSYDLWLQAIRYTEKRVIDYSPIVIQAEEEKGAAHFLQSSHSAEVLRLNVIKTQANARAIR